MSGGYKFDRLRVLIVDDNQHMRKLMVAIVSAFGCKEVLEAETAAQGWRMFQEHKPDVVFLDWVLGNGPIGIELARHIRNAPDSYNPFIPIVMLTGHTRLENVRMARDAGVTEFLAKPVSAEQVLKRLVSIIEAPRPFVRTKTYFGPDRRRNRREDYVGPERRAEPQKSAPPAARRA